MSDFPNVKPGVWVQPRQDGYLMKCCDCGLVHRVYFRVVKNNKDRKAATIQNARYRPQWRMYRVAEEA